FLNTTDETAMGPGLGLETGYGFWLYDACGGCDFTVFKGVSSQRSSNAQLIEDLIESGHLDFIHGYGDFSEGGFERRHAEEALEYLAARNLQLQVWVNHGGDRNTQQIGRLPQQRGDNRNAKEYHTDLLLAHGIKFAERFEIIHTVGQDAPCNLSDRLKQAGELLLYAVRTREWRARSLFSNRLLGILRLDDGQAVYSFRRFTGKRRGLRRAGSEELPELISRSVLDELQAKGGYAIIYTHLWRNRERPDVLPQEAQDALRLLADRQRRGKIYVTTTKKLLTYNLVHNHLAWEADSTGSELAIRIGGVTEPLGGLRMPALEELQGVTFYTPRPEATRLYLQDREIDSAVANPPDHTGLKSISIPLTRQLFPQKYRS
ncbi:MAG: hypothetical protein KAW67_09310, partial [Candidatus Eisenbacteria sp.]|nr:hypothetical protein [Candidatus Eisenbacteria bacterium]